MTGESPVAWPDELVRQASRRNVLLVLGAGVSVSSVRNDSSHPPSWENLLNSTAKQLGLDGSRNFKSLMRTKRFLDAASLLRSLARAAAKEQDFFAAIRSAVDGPGNDLFPGNAWHDAILRLDPDLVVTTNFDAIFERASQGGFTAHPYDSKHIGREVRRGAPVLLKIHGGVGQIEDVILTRQDFARVRTDGRHALEVLRSLLTTRSALLIGYSLTDPDIQLLFENVLAGRSEVPAHYMYCQNSIQDYEREILRDNYGVVPVTFPRKKFDLALSGLQQLADQVEATRAAGLGGS